MTTTVATTKLVAKLVAERAAKSQYNILPQYQVNVMVTKNGEHFVTAHSAHGFAQDSLHFNSGPLANEAAARTLANDVFSFIRNEYSSTYTTPVPGYNYKLTFCSHCERFNTLVTKQHAWSDDTHCTTEGCDYKSSYRIGD